MQLYFCDVSSVTYMLDKHFDYLDRKYILQGGKNDGPVRLEYEQTSENHLIVCSAPGNSHLCKSSRWKVDGVEAKCMDEEAARNAGEATRTRRGTAPYGRRLYKQFPCLHMITI